MPSSKTRQIWENGTPLRDAWLALASDEEMRRHNEMPDFLTALSDLIEPLNFAKPALASFNASALKRENEERLKDDLLESLLNNQFVATGYLRAPNIRPKPVVIDPDTFGGDENVDWRRSTISNLGVTFDNVRITALVALGAHPPKSKGRPGSNKIISAAIDELIKCDPQFCADSRKVSCQKIRDFLGVSVYIQTGFSDINLAKYIIRKCPKRAI